MAAAGSGTWRRRVAVVFWRLTNPLNRPFAGRVPWWVLLETVGRRTGRRRTTPLASGPRDGDAMWLISVHGRHAAWVANIENDAQVRLRHRGRWYDGVAAVLPMDEAVVGRFNVYARTGPRTIGIDPALIRVQFR